MGLEDLLIQNTQDETKRNSEGGAYADCLQPK